MPLRRATLAEVQREGVLDGDTKALRLGGDEVAELQRELQEVRREIECNTTAQAGTPRTAVAAAARWPELAAVADGLKRAGRGVIQIGSDLRTIAQGHAYCRLMHPPSSCDRDLP